MHVAQKAPLMAKSMIACGIFFLAAVAFAFTDLHGSALGIISRTDSASENSSFFALALFFHAVGLAAVIGVFKQIKSKSEVSINPTRTVISMTFLSGAAGVMVASVLADLFILKSILFR